MRTFDAPGGVGHARSTRSGPSSALNRVPAASRASFEWTINPYRGCGARLCVLLRAAHARVPRPGPGRDFEREIVVKVNVPEVLRAELRAPSWRREHVALGTNTDPYQWVEGATS